MKRRMVSVVWLSMLGSVAMAGSLSGTVLDRSTMLPISGAIVTVHVLLPDSVAFPDTTDETGAYVIEGIIPGNEIYVVMAGKPLYRGYYLRSDEIGAGSYSLDVLLDPEENPPPGGGGDSSEVSGQVLGRDGATRELMAVAGAEVRFVSSSRTSTVLTDLHGRYQTLVAQGSYAVTVSAAGFQDAASQGLAIGETGLTYGVILVQTATEVLEWVGRPAGFTLLDVYPNPCNPTARIRYSFPSGHAGPTPVILSVHDMLGRQVAVLVEDDQVQGTYEAVFDGTHMPSGVYICHLRAGPTELFRKIILAK